MSQTNQGRSPPKRQGAQCIGYALTDRLPFLVDSSNTVMKGDRCPFTDDLDGRGYVAPVRPLPGTELPTGKKAGARQLDHTKRSATFNRPAALPVVAAARHGILLPKSLV